MADFPLAEYEARLARAQEAMAAAGLDAILLTTEAEFRYFSGFRTAFWLSPTRPWFLILPRAGEPVAVIPEIGAALMAETCVNDVRTWPAPRPEDDGVSLLRDALRPYPRLGLPMGPETSLRMPLADLRALGRDFADAAPLLRALLMVKSQAEIAKIGAICRIGSAAFARAPALFSACMSMEAAFRAFRIALLEEGAEEVPYLVGGHGPAGYADVISPPGPEPLREGDVLMLDTGASREGYFCDFDRNFALGHASDAARRGHARLYAAVEAGLAAARPGETCAGLWRAMARSLGDGAGADVGRFGHGLGMRLTEPPSLAPWDETRLAPGMVLTLEPSVETAPGLMMVAEENIVIEEGGTRLLTERAPAELPVI